MKKMTVSQFAKMCGESKSTVYSRLDGDLKPFVFDDGGIKYIDFDAFEAAKNSEEAAAPLPQPTAEETKSENDEVAALKARIAELETQLAAARETNSEKENRLLDMLDRVIEATNANQVLTRNNQELQAKLIETQKLLALPPTQEETKKNWFARLFSRK